MAEVEDGTLRKGRDRTAATAPWRRCLTVGSAASAASPLQPGLDPARVRGDRAGLCTGSRKLLANDATEDFLKGLLATPDVLG